MGRVYYVLRAPETQLLIAKLNSRAGVLSDWEWTRKRRHALLPDCHLMFVYDAGRATGAERPEALAFITLEFFKRRDLFLVSRENGVVFP